MFESIFEDLKRYFRSGNMISRIIILNALVFVLLIFIKLGLMSTGESYGSNLQAFTRYISLNESMIFNLKHPWVFVSHAFTHFGFFHVLFNMLMLLWFGRIVGDLLGDRRILPIYILGIIAGIIFFWLSAVYISPGTQIAYGASAAVMAIIVASGFTAPDYQMHLILIGPVKIKFIVAVLLILDLMAVSNLSNTGGSIAHLGGALAGGLFVVGLRNGYDLSEPINRIIDNIVGLFTPGQNRPVKKRSPLKVSFKAPKEKRRANQRTDNSFTQQSSVNRLDEILDKIKDKGISSLSNEEKEFLDNQSKEK